MKSAALIDWEAEEVVPQSRDVDGGDGTDAAFREAEPGAEGIAEGIGSGLEEKAEGVAVPRLREKMPRRTRGMVKTNWRWGTS